MGIKLVRIDKLRELLDYEHPNTTHGFGTKDVWTRNVPLMLEHRDGYIISVNEWLYHPHNDELVYHKEKNRWSQGSEHYDIGKSHIANVYVTVLEPKK